MLLYFHESKKISLYTKISSLAQKLTLLGLDNFMGKMLILGRGFHCEMVLMKIGKQMFYYFYMKCMMWLDYARPKFPIPWLQEGRKKFEFLLLILTFPLIVSEFHSTVPI